MTRADEIVRACLKTNKASYTYLNMCSSNMFYEFPDKALTGSDFPLLVCQKVAHAGRPLGLGTFEQVNRVPVQIDLYYPQHDYESVTVGETTTKYFGYHLLKNLAYDVWACLRSHLKETTGVLSYAELNDMRMPIEEVNRMPLCRKTLELEITLKNAE